MNNNPCKDCPNRKSGCSISCEKWQEYEKIRDANYVERYDNFQKRWLSSYKYNTKGKINKLPTKENH